MIPYPRWIRARLRQRLREYLARPRTGLFSLITPVYDTPPRFLRALARSVFRQDYPWFEWIVVDNGSRLPETRRCLERLCQDDRVKLIRIAPNQGIMGGTRAGVAEATGRYVLPVDSDDLLYPDALRVLAAVLEDNGYPPLAYSDEDKAFANGTRCHPFFKPGWDPVLFTNMCYVAHLCALDRIEAGRLGAYTDERAHGCHDWDTFFRFIGAGHTPLHVPEVLYTWRMHGGSTSTPDHSPKPYTLTSQQHVLSRQLEAEGLADRFEVRANPLACGAGLWQVARMPVNPVPLHVLLQATTSEHERRALQALAESSYPLLRVHVFSSQLDHPTDALQLRSGFKVERLAGASLQSIPVLEFLNSLAEAEPVVVLQDAVVPLALDWPWEVLGLFEAHSSAAVVGGRILDSQRRVFSAGEVFGMDGFLASPDRGRSCDDKGLYGQLISQRSVDAVSALFIAIRAGLLRRVLAEAIDLSRPQLLSAWLAARARQANLRVVYTPHVVAQRLHDEVDPPLQPEHRARFHAEFGHEAFDARHYARFYSRASARAYHLLPMAEVGARRRMNGQASGVS